ncbi:MAG: hypothetical protein ACI35T_02540 [Alistipes sp.]
MKGISKRVAIGFMSIVALLFISGMISLFELSNLSNDTENILSTGKRNMELAKDMLNSAHDHSRAIINMAIFHDHGYDSLCRSSLNALEERIASARSESFNAECLDSLAITVKELRTLSDAYLAPAAAEPNAKSVEPSIADDFALAEGSVTGKIWYETKYQTVYTRLLGQIKHFMQLTHSSLAPRAAQLNRNAYRSVTPVFISLLVMIAIVLMFFYFVNVYCVHPIVRINTALSNYLTFKLPFRVKAELLDELKELHDNIDTLVNISKQTKQ